MNRTLFNTALFAALLSLVGCMGYHLGNSKPEGINRLYLAPVINHSRESAVELPLTHALRARIQFDNRIDLATTRPVDATMEVTVTDYTIHAISFNDDQRTTASEYRIRLSATATLRNSATGALISQAANYGEKTFKFTSDLTTLKRDAARGAADDLAKYLIDDLLEQWN